LGGCIYRYKLMRLYKGLRGLAAPRRQLELLLDGRDRLSRGSIRRDECPDAFRRAR
jgi:hypothetical protein